MLTHPTIEKLHELRCPAMAKALAERSPRGMSEERLGLLVDREMNDTPDSSPTGCGREARHRAWGHRLRQPRGLDKDSSCRSPTGADREHLNCLITGPAGIGKSWIACALAHGAAATDQRRVPAPDSAAHRAVHRTAPDERYPKLLASLAKTQVLVIDDFGLAKLSAENRRDLLEIIAAMRSTIVTSQLPVEKWHAVVGDPTLADAILDRLVHRAYQLNLKGESMRKRHQALTQTDHQSS